MGWIKVADERPPLGRLVWVYHGSGEEMWTFDKERDFSPGWVARMVRYKGQDWWFDSGGRVIDAPLYWHERWPKGLPERNE